MGSENLLHDIAVFAVVISSQLFVLTPSYEHSTYDPQLALSTVKCAIKASTLASLSDRLPIRNIYIRRDQPYSPTLPSAV